VPCCCDCEEINVLKEKSDNLLEKKTEKVEKTSFSWKRDVSCMVARCFDFKHKNPNLGKF
jgi:energy-converting hydrogenase A subunit M